jgi:hypothetical protein
LQATAQRNPAAGRTGAGRTNASGSPRIPSVPRSGTPVPGVHIGAPLHVGSPYSISTWRIPRGPIFFRSAPFYRGYGGALLPHCGFDRGWTYPCFMSPPVGAILGPITPPVSPQYPFAVSPYISGYPDLEAYGAEGNLGTELKQILLYLKDGSVYGVAKYSVSDGKLQYSTSEGVENSIDLDRVDAQKTVDANTARGVKFSLEPTPPVPPSAAPGTVPPQK